VIGGVEIFSSTGILIITIGILFTVAVPLIMILKGNKIKFITLSNYVDNYQLLVTKQSITKCGIILKSLE
tara:strand:- start:1556 stop:1765 length:210 start_codon:yes stop_codon:yes gene_type:complete